MEKEKRYIPRPSHLIVANANPEEKRFIINDMPVKEEQINDVLRMHAEFQAEDVIEKEMLNKYGVECYCAKVSVIKDICKDNRFKLTVSNYRSKYINRVKDVAISHKRVRMEDLEFLRKKYLVMLLENECGTAAERKEFRIMARGLNDILIAARDEIDGRNITFNQLNVIEDLDDKTDDELIARRDELIRKAERSLLGVKYSAVNRIGEITSDGNGSGGDAVVIEDGKSTDNCNTASDNISDGDGRTSGSNGDTKEPSQS